MAILVPLAPHSRSLLRASPSSEGNLGVPEARVVPEKEKDRMKLTEEMRRSGGRSNGPGEIEVGLKYNRHDTARTRSLVTHQHRAQLGVQ